MLLMVEAVLLRRKCSMQDWGNLYTELATRQLKVKVSDRTLVKTEQVSMPQHQRFPAQEKPRDAT